MSDETKVLTRGEQRSNELSQALAEVTNILDRADATFAVQQTMMLADDGSPRYSFIVKLVSR